MGLGPLEEGIQSPETKREVNDSVYLLSKRENDELARKYRVKLIYN